MHHIIWYGCPFSLSRYNSTQRHISHPSKDLLYQPGLSFSLEYFPAEFIHLAINTTQSKATTTKYQALGRFNRINMKIISTWDECEQGERKQLNQMHDPGMFGKPIDAPKNSIVLRPHRQYYIKIIGTHRARQCCDGSKRAATILVAFTLTHISCA